MASKLKGKALKAAAAEVADLMWASLSKFSPEEQDRRLDAIHKIALNAGRGKTQTPSKPSRTRASHPRSGPRAARVRTRAGRRS
jgi:hypothetical protein